MFTVVKDDLSISYIDPNYWEYLEAAKGGDSVFIPYVLRSMVSSIQRNGTSISVDILTFKEANKIISAILSDFLGEGVVPAAA